MSDVVQSPGDHLFITDTIAHRGETGGLGVSVRPGPAVHRSVAHQGSAVSSNDRARPRKSSLGRGARVPARDRLKAPFETPATTARSGAVPYPLKAPVDDSAEESDVVDAGLVGRRDTPAVRQHPPWPSG